jgi:GT2 family glycosyltransferase
LFPDVQILKGDGNLWCNGGFNLALRHCIEKGNELFLLLNNDNVIAPDALNYLVETRMSLNAPIVGSLVGYLNQPDIVSYAGKRIDWRKGSNIAVYNSRKIDEIPHEIIEADFLGFQGVLISKTVFDKVGFFDDGTFRHYCCDTDFYLRAAKAGFKTLVDTRSVVWDDVDTKGPAGPSPNLREFVANLKSVKSIAHLPTRYRFYRRHSPVFWLRPFGLYYAGLIKGQLAAMLKHRFANTSKNI